MQKRLYIKFRAGSNAYLVGNTLIDTGDPEYKHSLKKAIAKIIDLDKITRVIFTHLHYDHISNFSLFKNAKFYASGEEIAAFKKNPRGAVMNEQIAKSFNVSLIQVEDYDGFKIIHTPGHTVGSICILCKGVLFSGDTLFDTGYGRTDLPTSVPEKMEESLKKLSMLKYNILCPGHDYG